MLLFTESDFFGTGNGIAILTIKIRNNLDFSKKKTNRYFV